MDKTKFTDQYELYVNGKCVTKCAGTKTATKAEFVAFLKSEMNINVDLSKDTFEVRNVTPSTDHRILQHKARETSMHNKYIDAIISRHMSNLVSTYGEAKVFKLLADVYGVTKPETKAS